MYTQGSFPALPEIILTAGTAFKPALFELDKKHPVYGTPKFAYFRVKIEFCFRAASSLIANSGSPTVWFPRSRV